MQVGGQRVIAGTRPSEHTPLSNSAAEENGG